jgi:NADPH-dependent ferric siderophore reductase
MRIEDVTPRLRRVVLSGQDLHDFDSDRPGQWVKLFFGDDPRGRAFTIRRWNRERREMTVDFVSHGHGLAGAWVQSAKPGDTVRLAGPRSDFRHIPAKPLFLFGDETALPAISAIVEAMPAGERALVVIETKDATAQHAIPSQANIHWVWLSTKASHRPGSLLAAYAPAITLSPESDQLWIACESDGAKRLRSAFAALGFTRETMHASGYWKKGASEHVDAESDY